ncbi:hypothetical protein [Actinacidiphila rubida]|uniref:hypothetical protein n=1 Tax=Actinacidiphila rubida TaxID=310780 RepID=UPI00114D31C8|nr:hypothetical protein [Actinacidiphila rubida]
MKLTTRFAAVISAVTGVMMFGAGVAQAQGDGGLLSLLGNASVLQVCYPMGQVGQGNSFSGTQNISCSQSGQATAPAGSSGGGLSGAGTVSGTEVTVPAGAPGNAIVTCPDGQIATGGGYIADPNLRVVRSYPYTEVGTGKPVGWVVDVVNDGSASGGMIPTVVCADAAA